VFQAAAAIRRTGELRADADGAHNVHSAPDSKVAADVFPGPELRSGGLESSRQNPMQPVLRAKLDLVFACIEDLVPRGPRTTRLRSCRSTSSGPGSSPTFSPSRRPRRSEGSWRSPG